MLGPTFDLSWCANSSRSAVAGGAIFSTVGGRQEAADQRRSAVRSLRLGLVPSYSAYLSRGLGWVGARTPDRDGICCSPIPAESLNTKSVLCVSKRFLVRSCASETSPSACRPYTSRRGGVSEARPGCSRALDWNQTTNDLTCFAGHS